MLTGGSATNIVPPIAGEELLAEDGAIRAQEGILPAAHIANVEHLLGKTFMKSSAIRRAHLLLRRVKTKKEKSTSPVKKTITFRNGEHGKNVFFLLFISIFRLLLVRGQMLDQGRGEDEDAHLCRSPIRRK